MSGETSLDEFARDESEPASADGPASESTNDREPDPDVDAPSTVATSTWHGDGADCDRCGARVDRRWRDGDALVCADCASW